MNGKQVFLMKSKAIRFGSSKCIVLGFIAEISWHDALELNKHSLTRSIADQLYRAVCSISANIAEGIPVPLAKTVHDFSNILLALPAKHGIGITNLITH